MGFIVWNIRINLRYMCVNIPWSILGMFELEPWMKELMKQKQWCCSYITFLPNIANITLYHTLIFQFPIYLEPSSQASQYIRQLDPWFQIYRELEDEGYSRWFQKIGEKMGKKKQNGWFRMENLLEWDDLGVPLFLETPTLYHILDILGGFK